MAAWCYFWRKVNGWMDDRPREIAEGAALARRAVEVCKDDPVALARSGHALAHLAGEFDGGVVLIDKAVALNPNFAAGWFLGGFLQIWRGEHDDAIKRFERAMHLNPLDPEMFRMHAGVAIVHLLAGRFDDASSTAEKAFRDFPGFLIVVATMAASHALAGRADEARRAMDRLRQLDPALRISNLRDLLPLHRPQDLALLTDGLRRAGLPE
jgi:tetratricopeptide (TPR) repeat protein